MTLLFVYGTLKRGGSNHALMAGQNFLGEARTQPGYRLYALDGHPGMVAKSDDRDGVTGEVWSVDEDRLAELDRFEGLTERLYRREPVKVLAPFANQTVETYIFNQSVEDRADIGSTW
jgi:gamma-glutamylaminecyclotransferase